MRLTLFAETGCWKQCMIWPLLYIRWFIHHTLFHPFFFGGTTPSCLLRMFNKVTPWAPYFSVCLPIATVPVCMKSAFSVMYLDDVTIGGHLENISHDLNVIKKAKVLGLSLNNEKSEIICEDATVRGAILCPLPGAQVILPEEATLLGSPLSEIASIDASLKEKTKVLHLHDGCPFQAYVSP